MINQILNSSQQTARLAGFLYLLLIPLGYFGVLYVSSLVAPEDMTLTIENIVASESMYRLSMASALLMNVVSVLLVLALYKLLKSVDKNMAGFMVVLLLPGAGIAMLNELNHFVLLALSNVEAGTVFTAGQLQYLVGLSLDMYEFGSYIAAIFWGLWLFPLGYLIYKSNFVPKILGVLLVIAGVGYVVDSFLLFLAPQLGITITDFTFIGEITIMLWLLIKGVNVQAKEKAILEPA
ncbi:MAG: DUF4386 domain-containing protein [Chloroflexi bacterium]|nr:MAG: DUF4386 domain-containing protein [Chloroflexota bacterium]MBL1195337.1 DUF4386 domain-containing protein [Chloroflexota bacterium]NOH12621.1 DUF4386 domain-containing protein [Chloroflexota bacterium]